MVSLGKITRALQDYSPSLLPDSTGPEGGRRAGVALVMRPGDESLLFIERAERQGDPWSGHLAFPGGRLEDEDGGDLRRTAERETAEEVGVDLGGARRLGRLDDVGGALSPVVVAAYAYVVGSCRPQPNDEVRRAFWVPLADLGDPGRRRVFYHGRRGGDEAQRPFPALDLLGPGRPLLWGLSYRMVARLLGLAGCALPLSANDIPLEEKDAAEG